MSNRNDEGMAWVLPIALMAATAIILFFVVYALAVIISLGLTIVAVVAWNRPLTLVGETVKPEEARLFIASGIAGVFILPLIVLFLSALLKFQVRPDLWGHFYLGGYALGSLGTSWIVEQAGIFKDSPAETSTPVFIAGPEAAPEMPLPPFRFARWRRLRLVCIWIEMPLPPFRFARWDDEEDKR